jgi:hypothetical protein
MEIPYIVLWWNSCGVFQILHTHKLRFIVTEQNSFDDKENIEEINYFAPLTVTMKGRHLYKAHCCI